MKRSTCPRCLRPESACICQWVSPVTQSVQVLILQHPGEVAHAKGSARLLHLSLQSSRMHTGEVFEPQLLHELLHGDKTSVLLYPTSTHDAALGIAHPPIVQADVQQAASQLQLVVLDATWRKSRKMLYRNPALQALPRMALQDPPMSNYRIRKAHQPYQLSSLEATCAALRQLGSDAGQLDALLAGFAGFVGQQMAYRLGL